MVCAESSGVGCGVSGSTRARGDLGKGMLYRSATHDSGVLAALLAAPPPLLLLPDRRG
jgi:hypothetical protein